MNAGQEPLSMFEEGGIYITRGEWGKWFFFRVLRITDGVVHLRLYKRKFWLRPRLDDFDGDDWEVGHIPIDDESAKQWSFERVGCIAVTDDELAGFRLWAQDQDAGVFS